MGQMDLVIKYLMDPCTKTEKKKEKQKWKTKIKNKTKNRKQRTKSFLKKQQHKNCKYEYTK